MTYMLFYFQHKCNKDGYPKQPYCIWSEDMDVFILEVQNKLHFSLTTKRPGNGGILTLIDVQGFMQYMWMNSILSQEMHEYTCFCWSYITSACKYLLFGKSQERACVKLHFTLASYSQQQSRMKQLKCCHLPLSVLSIDSLDREFCPSLCCLLNLFLYKA